MTDLFPFQADLHERTHDELAKLRAEFPNRAPNVLTVSATGSGKTVMKAANILQLDAPQAAIAHRQELISQISMALAVNGVRHGIVAPDSVVSMIRRKHLEELDVNYVQQSSDIRVCGPRSLINLPDSDPWLRRVARFHNDEAHHVLKENEWGRAIARFPSSAEGIGYTATPIRADGRGLGREWDGIYDSLLEGPKPRHLIDMGFLTDYRLICEDVKDLDLSQVHVTASGDLERKALSKAVRASREICGNVVKMYLRHAAGMLGITFAVDVEEATKYAQAFRDAGVSAEVVSGDTPQGLRDDILRRFARRELKMLVNVDLFGEGFDVPAVQVVIMARPTESFSLYSQQFGRALRIMYPSAEVKRIWGRLTDAQRLHYIANSEKPSALVIDLVGNWARHGLPDDVRRVWSLERRRSRGMATRDPDVIGLRKCLNVTCFRPYERELLACPWCGEEAPITGRSTVEEVDGDVVELSPEVLKLLRGEAEKIDRPPAIPQNLPAYAQLGIVNRHRRHQELLGSLRFEMAVWMSGRSMQARRPLCDREQAKLFYKVFGVDVLTAQGLRASDMEKLLAQVRERAVLDNIVPAA